jgi:secondary thiamine-phosphate synthase enzyme
MDTIRLRTTARSQMLDITDNVQRIVERSGVREGVVCLQSLHTTGALTINENADPDVVRDVRAKMERLVPRDETFYRHAEGNSDSHLKTSMFGPSLMVLISEGRLVLGTWQGVYFCEWDGPRDRRVAVQVLGGGGVGG